MAPIQLVGLAGRAGAGKTMAARILCERAGFERLAFAAPLKAMLRALGLGDAELDGAAKERPSPLLCGRSPRQAMQTLGTEWGRERIGADLWAQAWTRAARDRLAQGRTLVADDVRFANEIAAIRGLGGRVYWIDRGAAAPPAHVSEALDPAACDGAIVNDGGAGFQREIALALLAGAGWRG